LVLASNTTPFLTTNLSGNVSNFLVSPINASQNNATQVVYTVASLVDNGAPTTCPAGPQDITNNAVVTINPRPTASLTVGGQAAICNGSSTSLRVALTGLGPWTLVLASNTTPFLTTNLSGNVSNFLVRPINASQNNATQVVYAVASLVDNGAPTTCPAGPQDITNNAVVTINPRPTVSLTVSGQPAICNGSSTSLRVALTGLGPWTLILASNTTPFLTTNLSGNVSNVLVTPLNASPNSPTQVLYTVASLVDNGALTTCPAGPQDITNNAVVTINPRPTASLTVSGPATICNGNSTTLRVALTGLGPWTLTLASNTIPFLTTNLSGNVSNFLVTPVNASQISSTQVVYTVSSLVDNGAPTACPAGLLDFTNNATVTVNPTPAEPTNPVNQIGCAGLTNAPLSVNVLPGHSALWYTVATGGSSIFTGSSYNPTNAIEGTNRFYVASFDNATGCESTNRVEADLILQSCTNQLSITLAGTNVLVTWYGNYVLQNSTNLAPAYWMYVTQGLGGIMNTSIIPALPPPTNNFFRLYAPTN
jgi:uncharacterized membrane protein